MTYLLSLLLILCDGQVSTSTLKTESESLSAQIQITTDQLVTGWYYLSDTENGTEKTLKGTDEKYFIDPTPIVTIDNFSQLEIYQSNYGDYGLTIKLDEEGTKQWSIATGKSIGQKLALIIDNELYFTPIVNSQIDFGITALNRGDLSEKDLERIKEKLEKEKKYKSRP